MGLYLWLGLALYAEQKTAVPASNKGAAKDRARAKLWLQKAAEQTEDEHTKREAEKLLREFF